MLSIKKLREHLVPMSPQAAVEHWLRVFDKHGGTPEFENPRVQFRMRSGAEFTGYIVNGSTGAGGSSSSKDKYLIVSLVVKNDNDQARDIVYLNLNDIEFVIFYDVDPIIQFLARK